MNDKYNKLLEEKIEELEGKDYRFPERFGIRDYLFVIFICAVCLAFIIAGAGL